MVTSKLLGSPCLSSCHNLIVEQGFGITEKAVKQPAKPRCSLAHPNLKAVRVLPYLIHLFINSNIFTGYCSMASVILGVGYWALNNTEEKRSFLHCTFNIHKHELNRPTDVRKGGCITL